MNGDYLAVAGHIRRELDELSQVVERTENIWEQMPRFPADYYVDAAALNLHGYYAGVERIFEMIARRIDQSLPSGAHWHQELLKQMAVEITGVRPAVLSIELRDKLGRYLGFRHVIRNIYTFDLDADSIASLVADLPETVAQLERALTDFAELLEQIGRD